jgi:putative ABC transport system permease protein
MFGGGITIFGEGGVIGDGIGFTMPTFTVLGCTDGATLSEFDDKTRHILHGRMYQNPGEVMISEELAELNGITLDGDNPTITLAVGEETYTFTVVGIYADFTESAASGFGGFRFPTMNRSNEILTSFETLITLTDDIADSRVQVTAKYILRNPDLLGAFETQLRDEYGLPDHFLVSVDDTSYNAIVKPVLGMMGVTRVFIAAVLGLGAVILLLVSALSIRERKYEIGVLRAMGLKKHKVVSGLLYETLMVTAFCLVLGLSAGTLSAQRVSDALLSWQNDVAEETAPAQNPSHSQITVPGGRGGGFTIGRSGPGGMLSIGGQNNQTEALPLTEMNVSLGFDTLWQIVVIAIFLAAAASVIGIITITRHEPIKILSERN